MDVTANQDEISDDETFQLEFEPSTKRWYMRTMKDKYFTLQPGGGVQANENKRQVLQDEVTDAVNSLMTTLKWLTFLYLSLHHR